MRPDVLVASILRELCARHQQTRPRPSSPPSGGSPRCCAPPSYGPVPLPGHWPARRVRNGASCSASTPTTGKLARRPSPTLRPPSRPRSRHRILHLPRRRPSRPLTCPSPRLRPRRPHRAQRPSSSPRPRPRPAPAPRA